MNSCLTICVHNWSYIVYSVSSGFPRNTFWNQWFHIVRLKAFKSISDRIVPNQFPFSTAVFKLHEYLMSSSVLWVFTQRRLVVAYRRFGTA